MPYGITITMKSIGRMKRCEGYADCALSPIKEGAIIEAKKETERYTCVDGKTIFIVEKRFIGTKSLKDHVLQLLLQTENRENFDKSIENDIASLQSDVVEGGKND